MGKYLDQFKAETAAKRQQESRSLPTTEGASRVTPLGGFLIGAADTMTFGYADEILASADHVILGKDRDQQLAYWRNALHRSEEEQRGWTTTGQVAGGLTGGVGALKTFNALKGARGLAVVGATEGALYGSGSADGGLGDRLMGAGGGAVVGATGGWLLGKYVIPGAEWGLKKAVTLTRWGRSPKLATSAAIRAEEAAEGAVAKANVITGKSADEIEDGALFSMKELLGDRAAARTALEARLGKLTAPQAEQLANRLEGAMADGAQIDDPHFRSLLGFDISDPDVTADSVLKAVSIMEDGIDAVLQRKTNQTLTNAQVREEASDIIGQGVLMRDLEEALDRSRRGVPDQVVAQHAELFAGVSFVRAKEKYLPMIRRGVEGAREELTEALAKSAHIMAMARGIGSNAGRALQARKAGGTAKLSDVADDVFHMDSLDEIRRRVDGALKELSDDELTTLLGRLRTTDDLAQVNEVLTDANRAREWSGWQRTMNSVSDWLRSNALTPATGLFNTLSFVGHDFFRNSLAKRWAARSFERAGQLDDALALRFETEVGNRVYWEAHKRGVKAMIQRIQWEGWQSIEKIASVATGNEGRLANKARLKQTTMLDEGYQAPDLREFKPKPGIGVADPARFNEALSNRAASGGALARLINAADRTASPALTALDEAGKASMKLFTGAVDDYGRQFVTLKETYALSARYAVREAMQLGLPHEEMLSYAQRRAVELAEMPPSEILQRVEMKLLSDGDLEGEPDLKFLMDRTRAVDEEAARTLLLDGPQTGFGQESAKWLRRIDRAAGLGQVEGVLLPYINTPIRILERGLVSYGPFAKKSAETLAILQKGGVEAEIEQARIEVGTLAIKLGAALGATGAITVTNGAYTSSANLDSGPPNRLNLPGGGFVEIGRLDPFALTLAMGAMWGQAIRAGYHDYASYESVDDGFNAFVQTAFFAAKDGILEKSYLTSLQDLMDIVGARDEGSAGRKLQRFLQTAMTRVIPVSGTSRQLTETAGGYAPEVVTMGDALLRGIPGGSLYLSPQRDVLGDQIKSRTLGIGVGNSGRTHGHDISPVKEKLRDLGISVNQISKVDGGVVLSSEQVSELRRIRGKEARNAEGFTMEEALEALFDDPDFRAGDRDDQHDAVVDLMNDFNAEARSILESRDESYGSTREANRAFREYLRAGAYREEARHHAREDVMRAGLPDPGL